MLQGLPSYIPIIFILTVLVTLVFFIYAVRKSVIGNTGSNIVLLVLGLWLQFQLFLSMRGFYYTDTLVVPPRFGLLIFPPLITILILFATSRGRAFIDSLPLGPLTWLSIVRVPVEICLYWLCLYRFVPDLMTFDGRNFDILSGLSAPFIAYSMHKALFGKRLLLIWNIVALALLINIVVNAILSAPLAFQQFAFDQPNVAVLHFPFTWLPSFIVPIVLFTHLVSIRRLLSKG